MTAARPSIVDKVTRSPDTFTIATGREHLAVAGMDSSILAIPEALLIDTGGTRPAVNAPRLFRALHTLSEKQAAGIGEVLHHATWQITDDPAVIEKIGMHGKPDCAGCRAGVDQALARLADTGKSLLVGTLYWAGTFEAHRNCSCNHLFGGHEGNGGRCKGRDSYDCPCECPSFELSQEESEADDLDSDTPRRHRGGGGE